MIDTKKLYNLSYLIRYSNVPRIKDESVAEHSFYVAVEVFKLYEEYNFNLERAVSMAVCHDFLESMVDDVSYSTKKQYPEIKAAVLNAELMEVKEYPDFIRSLILEYIGEASIESMIVHLADSIQCLTYAKNEVSLGNSGYIVEVLEDLPSRIDMIKSKLIGVRR
jgi:5'-deoxynucleotidase YfbR-like HD superfamily hydrolase